MTDPNKGGWAPNKARPIISMTADELNSAADYLTKTRRMLRAARDAGPTEAGKKLLAEGEAMVDDTGFLALPEWAQFELLEQLAAANLEVSGSYA